jgi:hypothetical protein
MPQGFWAHLLNHRILMKTRITDLLGIELPKSGWRNGCWRLSRGILADVLYDLPKAQDLIDRLMADVEHMIQTRPRNFIGRAEQTAYISNF